MVFFLCLSDFSLKSYIEFKISRSGKAAPLASGSECSCSGEFTDKAPVALTEYFVISNFSKSCNFFPSGDTNKIQKRFS